MLLEQLEVKEERPLDALEQGLPHTPEVDSIQAKPQSKGNCLGCIQPLSRRAKWGIGAIVFATVLLVALLIVFLVILVNRTQADSRTVVYSQGLFFFAENEQSFAIYNTKGELLVSNAAPGYVVDDLTAADGVIFTLDFEDSTIAQHVIDNTTGLVSISSTSLQVPSRTFTGLSAANNRLVVSGGTSELSAFSFASFDPNNNNLQQAGTTDLGRGQPDVTLDAERPIAFVSTDFEGTVNGQRFGLTVLDISKPQLEILATIPLTNDQNIRQEASAFSPNFPLRVATGSGNAKEIIAVSYLEALSVFNTSSPSRPELLARFTASQLQFSPRAVAIDDDGNVISVGPVDRSNFDGGSRLGVYNAKTGLSLGPVQLAADGVTVSSVAVGEDTVAIATRNGPLFLNKTEVV